MNTARLSPWLMLAAPVLLSACSGRAPADAPAIAEPVQIAQYPGAPFEAEDGTLWITTVLTGVVRYDGTAFTTFTTADGLGSDMIRDVMQDASGELWFATTGGLTRYDGTRFETITAYNPMPEPRGGFGPEGFHRDLWDVMRDRHGTLWIATMGGVYRHDGTNFVRFPLPAASVAGQYEFTPEMVYCITEDRDGNLWFGTDGAGAVRYDGETFTVYTAANDGLASDRVCTIVQDRRGTYWFGTSGGGVSRYDGTSFETVLRRETPSEHVGWGRYMAIHEDRRGDIWIGVAGPGGGVHRFDGTSFRHFSEADGLGRGAVPSLSEDRQGHLWLGTTAGVYRYDGERFENFARNGWFPARRRVEPG